MNAMKDAGGTRRDVAEEIWYLPTSDECLLFVKERGQGAMIVVLHGGPGHSHEILLNAFDRFENEYRFVYYDQRGTLYSPCDASKISHEHNVQDLELLRKELGVGKLTLIAHSAGALLALSYMEKFANHVAHAILVAAPAFRFPRPSEEKLGEPVINTSEHDELIQESFHNQLEIEGLLKKFNERSLSTKELSTVATISFASAFLNDTRNWKLLRGGGVFFNPDTELAVHNSLPEPWDFTNMLQEFPGLITIINAANDFRINSRLWNHTKAEIGAIRYVEIENAGHALWIDQPAKFEQALRAALQRSV